MIGRYTLFGLVLGLGCVNALIRPVIEAIQTEGAISALGGFGVSFVIWGSLYWALSTVMRCPYEAPSRNDLLAALIASLGFVFPAATISWVIVGMTALYWQHAKAGDRQVSLALSVIVFAAFRDPLASLALKLFATPLLDGDALLTSFVMQVWDGQVARTGNLITGSDGHKLLILTGCTSYTNLSIALLAWFAMTRAFVGTIHRRQIWAGVSVAIAMVVINISRLALMGIGPKTYRFIHDGDGAIIVDLVMLFTTLLITARGCGYDFSKHRLLARV